eukprot:TRINITY_DN8064_c0_g1_i1.p1 TRINITY_DN8064_c0_g1~~TRINITY_DN8064_c0_g1_i1.p1  ORF type:complete len:891 (+),score=143.43 TRINITY_DN8064_c0_g1_i1:40-2673(+)
MMCMAAGARDANRFIAEKNNQLRPGSLPQPSTLTCEGVFNQHMFPTGSTEQAVDAIFHSAFLPDPLSKQVETFIAVGLNSKYDGDGIKTFGRLPANVVVVLDCSGSMGEPCGGYPSAGRPSKLQLASDCVRSIYGCCGTSDRFGLVTFNTVAQTRIGLHSPGSEGKSQLDDTLTELSAVDGTDVVSGVEAAASLLKLGQSGYADKQRKWFQESRIILLSDMQVTSGGEGSSMLLHLLNEMATKNEVFTTVVGVGTDFNTELTDYLATVPACTYYTVNNAADFLNVIEADFDYMVAPTAFDLRITLANPTDNVVVDAVYGTPDGKPVESRDPPGTLLYANSVMPSAKDDPVLTQGGVILVRVSGIPTDRPSSLDVKLTYKNRERREIVVPKVIHFDPAAIPNECVRKGALLLRFVQLMRSLLIDAHSKAHEATVTATRGICAAVSNPPQGVPAAHSGHSQLPELIEPVRAEYRRSLKTFGEHFAAEQAVFSDKKLSTWATQLKEYAEFLEKFPQLLSEDSEALEKVAQELARAPKPSAPTGKIPNGTEFDIAFCVDTTGSMGSYIEAAQEGIKGIVTGVTEASPGLSLRFALVEYKDYSDPFVTRSSKFTDKIAEMQKLVGQMSASGGGDAPEAVAEGLRDVLQLPWRPSASKVCVFIADAPPHGLILSGDSYPNGAKDGLDPLELATQLAAQGIAVYAVGCEPAVAGFTRDFMVAIAAITGGQYLPLQQAAQLSQCVIAGSLETLSLAEASALVEAEIADVATEGAGRWTDSEICERAHARLREKVLTWGPPDASLGGTYKLDNVRKLQKCGHLRLARLRGLNAAINSRTTPAKGPLAAPVRETANRKKQQIMHEQVHRLYQAFRIRGFNPAGVGSA